MKHEYYTGFRSLSKKISCMRSSWSHKTGFRSELHLAHVINESGQNFVSAEFNVVCYIAHVSVVYDITLLSTYAERFAHIRIRSSNSIELISFALIPAERENAIFRLSL